MPNVICVGGLGDSLDTFGLLEHRLRRAGHNVVVPNTTSVRRHEDRIELAVVAYHKCKAVNPKEKVFLVGKSAGGGAVRVAAERLAGQSEDVAGVIMLSPSMPFGVSYMTPVLWGIMKNHLMDLLFGRDIETTEKEYAALMDPISPEIRDWVIRDRTTIPGREARALALFAPVFTGYRYPTLIVHGAKDNWVAPRSQALLAMQLSEHGAVVRHVLPEAGHCVLSSREREAAIGHILRWIANRLRVEK